MAAKISMKLPQKKAKAPQPPDKRAYFKQSDFPQSTLQKAQVIASALIDNFAGKQGAPADIALAIEVSPKSSAWRDLAGSAVAYGLTGGGVNAQ
jgi:hypothetical protein